MKYRSYIVGYGVEVRKEENLPGGFMLCSLLMVLVVIVGTACLLGACGEIAWSVVIMGTAAHWELVGLVFTLSNS